LLFFNHKEPGIVVAAVYIFVYAVFYFRCPFNN
jgi:hypothetical protein